MPESTVPKRRLIYGGLAIVVLLIGFATRRLLGDCLFIRLYVGDGLWALMTFFGFAFVFPRWSTQGVATAALLFCFGIELSQLYHTPWIDSLRATTLGGLALGVSFVWSDLLCYTVGVAIGVFVDVYFVRPGAKAV